MKHAHMIGGIGEALLVLGSALYVVELLPNMMVPGLVPIISAVYAVALILMLISFIGTKEERKLKKEKKKAQKAAAKAQKAA